jgi:sugar fermentation stimulation protein A
MKFAKPAHFGILIKRYKRFLADIKLDNGEIITAHCANSGSMKTCAEPGWNVMVSDSQNPKRKLRYTWELVHNGVCWIGINTLVPNKLAHEAIGHGIISELSGYSKIRSEQKYGQNSRIDFLLENKNEKCFVEVKNVTLVENNTFLFPDAVTARGLKHLNELLEMKKAGQRAVMLYIIQRNDANIFRPCYEIDSKYAEKLEDVYHQGVEILPYVANVSTEEITISHKVEFAFKREK